MRILIISLAIVMVMILQITAQDQTLYFSAVQGEVSRIGEIILDDPGVEDVRISGKDAALFHLMSFTADGNTSPTNCRIQFQPDSSFLGIARAILNVGEREIGLTGISTTGIEGNHEATLTEVFSAFNISTDPGWSTLANHTKPDPQGDELGNYFFKKASDGQVEIIPLARYSPPYPLQFGYYINSDQEPETHQIGVLSDSEDYHEHQTLMPSLAEGQTHFDPGNVSFGLYVVSPTHTSYTEDRLNQLKFPDHVAHAARIYPVKDQAGNLKLNEFLVCFEEASNGDYQDYVFYLKNVELQTR